MGIGATTGAGELLANPLIISVGVRGVTKRQSCMYTYVCARGTLLVCIGLYGLYGLFSSIMEITDDDGRSAWPLLLPSERKNSFLNTAAYQTDTILGFHEGTPDACRISEKPLPLQPNSNH